MKKIYVIVAAVAALMAFSCVREAEIVESVAHLEPVYMKCIFPEAPAAVDDDTKVAINLSTGKTTWEVGDQILVHGQKTSEGKVVTLAAGNISADGKTATIDVSGVPTYPRADRNYESDLYACYPASVVPNGNLYYNNVFTNTNHLLLAACNDGDTFRFYNICGVIAFMVDDEDIKSYTFTGNAGETVAYNPLMTRFAKKTDGTFVEEYVRTGSDDGGFGTVALTTVSGTCVADGTTVNYVYLPGGTNFSQGFTFLFRDSGDNPIKIVATKKSYTVNVAHGTLLNLGDISSYLKTYVPPATHDSSIGRPADGSSYDLSKSGSANSYVVEASSVNAGKVYKFKAYRGNTDVGVGKIASVEVLWETWNNAESVTKNSVIADVDYDKQDGKDYYEICFKTPSTIHAGNAVIAAKDDLGAILWSWHIWMPSTTISSGTYGVSTPAMMDRNLGALVVAGNGDIRANGLLYQWGRKDPFVGQGAHGSSTIATINGTAKTVSSSELSVAESIANPTEYSKAVTGDKYYWVNPGDNGMWSTSKTVYDPCPPGWKVPHSSESVLFTADVTAIAGYLYDAGNYCVTIGSAVFPLAGRLYYSSGNMNDRDAVMKLWSSNCSSNGLARWLSVDSSSYNHWDERSANACSVRCVVDSANPPVPAPTMDEIINNPARLARIGTTPIIEVYYTEYTKDAVFPSLAEVQNFTHINVGHIRFDDKDNGVGFAIPSKTISLVEAFVAYKASYPGLKVKMQMGGWGKNADGWSQMARDPAKRKAFIDDCVDLCTTYGIDGFDIDWEYPTYAAKDGEHYNGASPADYVNFITLLKEMREAMPDKILSFAASDSGKYTDNYGALPYIDYINVMTYDEGDPPYHNAPLYKSAICKGRCASEAIQDIFHGAQGVPYEMMNFGLAFYGHGDEDKYPSSITYNMLEEIFFSGTCNGNDVTGYNYRYWDDTAKVPYLGDALGNLYASYEDVESVNAKVAFAKSKGMLGVMIWEYREDNDTGTLRHAVKHAMDGTPDSPGRWERPGDYGGPVTP